MSKIFITEDGQRIEATGEVLQIVLETQAAIIADKEAAEAAEAAKAAAATSAIAKLTAIGLTSEEIAALRG